MPTRRSFRVPAPIVAVVNWLIPGAGYLFIGQIARGLTIGITILTLFALGILIGGVHVVDPPTFTPGVSRVASVLQKPWYIGQFLSGAVGVMSGWVGPSQPASHSRVSEIGTLYTAVAGMLNLIATIDAAYRATLGPDHDKWQEHADAGAEEPGQEGA
jgi:hypothetical protein